ncbi:MAG TPA: VWA domain-containing protein, partial [Longimicrobiaceae bacterium]|nr:VWA domain-containing protein [Longimicrobiaceae bacterium]
GQATLDGADGGPAESRVMILLTDGLPTRVPTPESGGRQEDTVIAEAARAKAAGTRIFTIGLGLGDDVLRDLLGAVASRPEDYHFAPDGEDLADVYRQIAGRIRGCG